MARLAVLAAWLTTASGHGNMLCPLPRQYRDERPVDWTHWMGIGPNNEFAPGFQNAANLNANIGGGTGLSAPAGSHGLCGDIGSRSGFSEGGTYGATPARHVCGRRHDRSGRAADGVPRRLVRISARRCALTTRAAESWLVARPREMTFPSLRAAVPSDGGASMDTPITQELLNEHVLEIDESTPEFELVTNYAGMGGASGAQRLRTPLPGSQWLPT